MILLNNSLIYIAFGILLQFFVEVKSQTAILKPGLRMAHTATLIDNKLYILGGGIPPANEAPPKETFLYLDLSVPFNNNNGLRWYDLSINNIVPPHTYANAVKGGANNNTLLLRGGNDFSGQTSNLVYTFNAQNNTWSTPKVTGVPPTIAGFMSPVVDYNGLWYLYGGFSDTSYSNDMFILDTINLSWKQASSINAPSPRTSCGAVFLPDKNIIYMGMYFI
jgi:hypothetical protein